jgi:pyruvate dehydrogenase E2 component (dihydrolipoamide acetyltransferase)
VAIVDILIPQMGEGLQEVLLVGFQKKPGDRIRRDEPLYSMETDKATMEVESPYEGVLKEWLAKEGEVLAIGAPVARIETDAAAAPSASEPAGGVGTAERPAAPAEDTGIFIPPRTRAYGKEKGLSEEELRRIPARTGKLMPADVDSYLEAKAAGAAAVEAEPASADYVERPLSPQQRQFVYRLKRSAQIVIPGTIKRPVAWSGIRQCVATARAQDYTFRPTEFQTFAYGVAQVVKAHPKFRSALLRDDTIREYVHANLGIAVARQNGELVTAVVPRAETLDYTTFVREAQAHIQAAREGEDQADADTQILLTYMGAHEILDAVPVLVAPAVAVLFIGAVYDVSGEPTVNLVLTFDHRLINGVEAAEFLNAVVRATEQIEQIAGL